MIRASVLADVASPANGNPVQFVNTPDVGVPSRGVTKVGDVLNTNNPEPVSSEHSVAISADVEDVIPVIGKPVHDVNVPDAGIPSAGVTNVGDVPNTRAPLPVSSDIAVASSAEVPVKVLSVKSIDLLVNTVELPAVTLEMLFSMI